MSVWGVDLSTAAIDLVVLGENQWDSHCWHLPPREQHTAARRLLLVAAACGQKASALLAAGPPPDVVYVERPTGRHPSPQLTMTAGIVVAALERELATVGRPGIVHLCAVTEWKRKALGNGNAKKPQIREWARETYGYTGERQDVADALGIAAAALRDLQHAQSHSSGSTPRKR